MIRCQLFRLGAGVGESVSDKDRYSWRASSTHQMGRKEK